MDQQHGTDQTSLATITGMVPIRPCWQQSPAQYQPGHTGKDHQHGTDQTSLATITDTAPIRPATLATITGTMPIRPHWQESPARHRSDFTCQAMLTGNTGTVSTRPRWQRSPARCQPGHTGSNHQNDADQTSLATITDTAPIRPATLATITGMVPIRPRWQGSPARCRSATLAAITGTVPTRPRWQETPARNQPGHIDRDHRHGTDQPHCQR